MKYEGGLHLNKFLLFLKNLPTDTKRLTLSGEISIGTNGRFGGNIAEIEDSLTTIVAAIKQDNPFLKVQSKRDLYELNIRLFAYRKLIIDRSFLEKLRCQFQSLLDYGNRFEGLTLRLNVYGELLSLSKNEKFRFINKQAEVAFMNTESPSLLRLPKKLSSKQIGIIMLIVLVLIGIGLLVYFNVIPLFPKPLVA
jgi:hypothetical protein